MENTIQNFRKAKKKQNIWTEVLRRTKISIDEHRQEREDQKAANFTPKNMSST
jgi:hypothetical protein